MGSLILAAIVLAVVGGIIAYGGDRLGTYVGKKRISFKWKRISLRPRHTATLYTTLSGSAIAVLTLFLLVGADSAFKRALLEGPQLIFENQHYKAQNKRYQAQIVKDQKTAADAMRQLSQAQSLLTPVKQQLTVAQKGLSTSHKSLRVSQQQLGAAHEQLIIVQNSLGNTNQRLNLAQQDVSQARLRLAVAEGRVRLAQQQVAGEKRNKQHLLVFNAQLTSANDRLKTTNNGLKLDNVRLAKRTDSSQRKLIFRTEQELGRLVVKAAQPVPLIENDLVSFLNGLGQTAEGRGAKEGVNNRAVVVAVPVLPGSSAYSALSLVDENKAVETLAQQIAARSSDVPGASVVVVARAVTNSFQGEQTSIRLQPYENVLIYPKDTPVATVTINGAQTPFQIVDALKAFLTEKVRPAAQSQHLILLSDPDTGQSIIGSVLDEATLQTLVQQIERLGGTAYVTAYASEDTYSSGPLHLRFDVTPVAPTVSVPPPAAVGGRS
jgi:hypothetical protein